ncbi:hypothetical protein ANCDUO_08711 [Ancylostoma duodenale]|uniref:Uncharacterized protein n=1 Tax=Ancylostoma duodenale TaxID=51022 RepID=A0A0C2GPN3_9BILA|nr:hypothetical protein ANCDUO_08711 [Ancylostoma duodenale]
MDVMRLVLVEELRAVNLVAQQQEACQECLQLAAPQREQRAAVQQWAQLVVEQKEQRVEQLVVQVEIWLLCDVLDGVNRYIFPNN